MYNCFLRRFCIKHLERNLVAAHGDELKNDLRDLAHAPTKAEADAVLAKMRVMNATATHYIETQFTPASAWQVSQFNSPHWGTLTSNQVKPNIIFISFIKTEYYFY